MRTFYTENLFLLYQYSWIAQVDKTMTTINWYQKETVEFIKAELKRTRQEATGLSIRQIATTIKEVFDEFEVKSLCRELQEEVEYE